ncbi:dinitrogenase iron-molybdenum cofactor [Candidatus Woesearchaeota archaeon]|nr:dinitrogenase iron-molybdenum cofactor [Candidatus Woesearchaeota archaeon]
MRLAISTDNDMVSEHFGRCPEFTIVDIDEGKVQKKEVIDNPGHSTGFIPKFLKEKDVGCVIAGGAGFRAQQLFDQLGIRLITGVQGKVDDVIEEFAAGELKKGESLCKPGKGRGYGLEKEDKQHD